MLITFDDPVCIMFSRLCMYVCIAMWEYLYKNQDRDIFFRASRSIPYIAG